jgi:hypothetical protein
MICDVEVDRWWEGRKWKRRQALQGVEDGRGRVAKMWRDKERPRWEG